MTDLSSSMAVQPKNMATAATEPGQPIEAVMGEQLPVIGLPNEKKPIQTGVNGAAASSITSNTTSADDSAGGFLPPIDSNL